MKKKLLAALLSGALAVSLLAGCGGTSGQEDSGASKAQTEEAGQASAQTDNPEKTLTVWHYFADEAQQKFMDQITQEFQDAHPGVTVSCVYVPRDELTKQYTMGAVSGELPDIGMMDNPEMAAYIEMGLCADITEYYNAWDEAGHYYEGPMSSCMSGDKVYGLPQNSNCLEMFYDAPVFEEMNLTPPTTWDELLDVCEKLKTAYPDKYPLAFSANNNEEGTFQFMPFLLSAGGSIDKLDSQESIRAISFWKELVDKGYVPRDVISWGQTEVNTQFSSGNVFMQVNGPWNISTMKDEAPDKEWKVCLLPKDKEYASVLGGENFAVTSACEDVELGWEYLSTLCNGKNTAEFCAYVGKFAPRDDGSQYSDVWDKDEALSVFNEGMQYAMPRGPHPKWNEFSGTISGAIQQVLTGEKDPETAMKDAQEAAGKIMN